MMTTRRGGSPYEALNIGLGQTDNKIGMDKLTRYHAFDRILNICTNCTRQWSLFTPEQQHKYWQGANPVPVDVQKTKMFTADLRLKGVQNDNDFDELVKPILDEAFEFRWLWWYLDDNNCRIRDYVDFILAH